MFRNSRQAPQLPFSIVSTLLIVLLMALGVSHAAIASVVVTQTEDRSFWSLWLLSTHIQQISAHQQIMDNHEIIVVPYFDDEAMSGADLVYLSPSLDELKLSTEEIDALVRFVEGGGRLIVPGDYSVWADEFRALAARFDVFYGESFVNGVQAADAVDFDNPIIDGPGGVVNQFTGSAVNDNLHSTNPDFRVIAEWQAGPNSIGYLQHGQGEVVILSDINTFDDEHFFGDDNQVLWTNLFEYRHPGRVSLSAAGDCPGRIEFEVRGASAGEAVAFIYAFGKGSVKIPTGYPCAGTTLGLNASAKVAGIERADADGIARFITRVPAKACRRIYMQALDVATCGTSNVVLID